MPDLGHLQLPLPPPRSNKSHPKNVPATLAIYLFIYFFAVTCHFFFLQSQFAKSKHAKLTSVSHSWNNLPPHLWEATVRIFIAKSPPTFPGTDPPRGERLRPAATWGISHSHPQNTHLAEILQF